MTEDQIFNVSEDTAHLFRRVYKHINFIGVFVFSSVGTEKKKKYSQEACLRIGSCCTAKKLCKTLLDDKQCRNSYSFSAFYKAESEGSTFLCITGSFVFGDSSFVRISWPYTDMFCRFVTSIFKSLLHAACLCVLRFSGGRSPWVVK